MIDDTLSLRTRVVLRVGLILLKLDLRDSEETLTIPLKLVGG